MKVAAVAAGVWLALALAGCESGTTVPPEPTTSTSVTPTESVTPTPTATPTPTRANRAWQLPLGTPLTQPVFVDGVALVFTAVDTPCPQCSGVGSFPQLTLVAIAPATGNELWRRAATTSGVSAEEPLAVTPVGTRVAYFRPAGQTLGSARLVVADVHTGKDVATSPAQIFSTPIEACDALATRLCGTARSSVTVAAERYSFVVSTGRFGPAPDGQPPVGSRPVGPGGLIDLGERTPERVGVFLGDKLLWSMPVVAYFPEGTTTDAGWSFMLQDDHYIGTLHQTYPVDGEVDMGNVGTASFEAESGKIAWSAGGTSLNCLGQVVLPQGVPVRCHYKGDAVFTDGVGDFSQVVVTLEGFVPSSGKRTWEFELAPGAAFLRGIRIPAISGAASLLLRKGSEQLVLDLSTGEVSVPVDPAVYLCPSLTRFVTGRGTVAGDPTLQPCTSFRSRTLGVPEVATLTALDQAVETARGTIVVLSGPDGLTGYRLR